MKGRVDKLRGIVTLITETLAQSKPTDPLWLVKLLIRFLGQFSCQSTSLELWMRDLITKKGEPGEKCCLL
jgi:hypothetical protein